MTSSINNQALPAHYRAWTWHGSAEPAELRLSEVTPTDLGDEQVWVRNHSIGLNPVDWKVLSGHLVDWQRGHVPGVDGSGVVVAVGAKVSRDWLGQRVVYHTGLNFTGSFAQYTPVPARALLRMPDALSFDRAAGVICPLLTASLAIDKLPHHEGQRLLISGAGGAVGLYLTQLAVARGFQVTVMCHQRHRERLLALGASDWLHGALGDEQSLPDAVHQRYDAVIDAIGSEHAAKLTPALRSNGHIVCIEGRLKVWPDAPFTRCISLHEVALGATHVYGDASRWRQLVAAGEHLLGQIAQGRMHVETLHAQPFEQLNHALEALRTRSFSGKAIIQFNEVTSPP